MKTLKPFHQLTLFLILCHLAMVSCAQSNHLDSTSETVSFQHDRWITEPSDIKYDFKAFITSFDSDDPTIKNGDSIAWGIPEWVAFEIQRGESKSKCKRPNPWLTDKVLNKNHIAPDDDTYKVSGTRNLGIVSTDYRYVRGHLCPFATAARISCDAAWNTCTVLNAVPQLQWQNNGIWKELEGNCTDWANQHKKVWVICGPIFFNQEPAVWIGQQGEVKAAVPDALFKIVIREAANETGIETIAFIIPNVIPKDKPLYEFVTNIEQIESSTGLSFLNSLSEQQQLIEKVKHGIPPLSDNYTSLSSSKKKTLRAARKKEFHEANQLLIESWFD